MILADKIINQRKKLGWSQEELAEKLGVSRQAVSKWEGAQAAPDLSKILLMAEIFGVTTDYLLKDEIESLEADNLVASDDSAASRRRVSLEDADKFMKFNRWAAPRNGLATALCVMSPVLLLFLLTLVEGKVVNWSENLSCGIGVIGLFITIAIAVAMFVGIGNREKEFEYIKKEEIETEYGVAGVVKERKKDYEPASKRNTIAGVLLCILCPVPLLITAFAEANDAWLLGMVCVLLCMVAVASYIFVANGTITEGFEALLSEGEFARGERAKRKKLSPFITIFWLLVVALFLYLGLSQDSWKTNWIIWPVSGVLYVVYIKIVKMILRIED